MDKKDNEATWSVTLETIASTIEMQLQSLRGMKARCSDDKHIGVNMRTLIQVYCTVFPLLIAFSEEFMKEFKPIADGLVTYQSNLTSGHTGTRRTQGRRALGFLQRRLVGYGHKHSAVVEDASKGLYDTLFVDMYGTTFGNRLLTAVLEGVERTKKREKEKETSLEHKQQGVNP